MNTYIKIVWMMGILFLLTGCGKQDVVFTADTASTATTQEISDEKTGDTGSTLEQEDATIYVYVCGYVYNPGVYALPKTARICDALECAGGVTVDGKPEALNQAEHMEDGQTLYVPGKEEILPHSGEQEDSLVDINTATKEELMTIPGIGASKAEDILAYREANGDFQTIEGLMEIPGIKEGIFNKMKAYIKCQ